MHVGDIDVMIDVCIYIYILSVAMECKKIAILGVFAECLATALGKVCFLKKI